MEERCGHEAATGRTAKLEENGGEEIGEVRREEQGRWPEMEMEVEEMAAWQSGGGSGGAGTRAAMAVA